MNTLQTTVLAVFIACALVTLLSLMDMLWGGVDAAWLTEDVRSACLMVLIILTISWTPTRKRHG